MHSLRILLGSLTLLAVTACNDTNGIGEPGSATVRVINASATRFDVLVDGDVATPDVSLGAITGDITVNPGTHQIRLVSSGGATATLNFSLDNGKTATAYAYSAASSLNAALLPDTGAIVPANKSKLRVTNLSTASSIEIWRTQPDFQTPVHIQTPFPYLATSPYLQSDPGNWEVFVTATGSTTKLATTGAVNVPAGESRSVILLDSAGALRFRVLVP